MEEVKDLEYCKSALEMLKPMSAAGYFAIGKASLTSILSVRKVFLLLGYGI